MITEKKYNYVYEIVYPNGMKYLGVRSCNCEVVEDKYLGSGFYIPDDLRNLGIKTILSMHDTRKEAMEEEIRLHALLDVKNNKQYYNQCNSTSTKFQISKVGIAKSAKTRTGRTKETHEYIQKQVESRNKYKGIENRTEAQRRADLCPERIAKMSAKLKLLVGDNQTEAQKLGRLAMKEKVTGVKNPAKGHPGIKSTSFVPWYYIEPNGDRHEMHSISKKDFAIKLGIPYRILIYRFSKENEHKPFKIPTKKSLMIKDWIFGNMQTPAQSLKERPKRTSKLSTATA